MHRCGEEGGEERRMRSGWNRGTWKWELGRDGGDPGRGVSLGVGVEGGSPGRMREGCLWGCDRRVGSEHWGVEVGPGRRGSVAKRGDATRRLAERGVARTQRAGSAAECTGTLGADHPEPRHAVIDGCGERTPTAHDNGIQFRYRSGHGGLALCADRGAVRTGSGGRCGLRAGVARRHQASAGEALHRRIGT